MAYIFLDESGQFKKHNHEEYFVIGSFTVGDHRRTAKRFRSWCSGKSFPKKIRGQSEIKWSSTGIDDELRKRTLKFISKLDVRIRFIYLLRNNIPQEYREETKFKDGLLYTNVVGELLDMYFPVSDQDLRVFCDRRKLSGMKSSEFKEIIKARVLPKMPQNPIVQIETVDSMTDGNIQIADWISGALGRYLEKRPFGQDFFNILKGNIIGEGKELFGTQSVGD